MAFSPNYKDIQNRILKNSINFTSWKGQISRGPGSNIAGASFRPTPSPTITQPPATPSNTPTITSTPQSPTPTPTLTVTSTNEATNTPTPTLTPTITPSNTPTNTQTDTPSVTPSNSPTTTVSSSLPATPTITSTVTRTPGESSTPTPTLTITPTITPTITNSSTITLTPGSSQTPTRTPTCTPSPTNTVTLTNTPTVSFTRTPNNTPTNTPTVSITRTPNNTPTMTPTNTPTVSITRTPNNTPTITPTNTPSMPIPSGLGVYRQNYNGSGRDVYVSIGYPISAIFDKTPGFSYATSMSLISALDRWGQILNGSSFNTRTVGSSIYTGDSTVSNPLSGQSNTSTVVYLSTFFANSGDLGNTLGYAGIELRRRASESGTSQYNIPFQGYMSFNSFYSDDDVATQTAGGKNTFYYTALHELGHVLGIGTNWYDATSTTLRQCFIVGAGDNSINPLGLGLSANFFYSLSTLGNSRSSSQLGSNTSIAGASYFIGDARFNAAYNANSTVGTISKAVTAYNNLFNLNLSAIPVENGRGFGSIGSHWDEGGYEDPGIPLYGDENRQYYNSNTPGAPSMNDELMTPQSEGEYDCPLSIITIGALADLGYTVNLSLADTYDPKVFNVYSGGPGNPLYIGFNGNTYNVQGFSFDTFSGKWIVLKRGITYSFNIFTGASHPIYIVTSEGNTGSPPATRVTNGVTNDGIGSGTMTWTVPTNLATGFYYLQCGNHSSMSTLVMVY